MGCLGGVYSGVRNRFIQWNAVVFLFVQSPAGAGLGGILAASSRRGVALAPTDLEQDLLRCASIMDTAATIRLGGARLGGVL